MRFFRLFRSLWRDRRANALMLVGLSLPFVIGLTGLGVHSIQLTLAKRQMQRAADSAALAGAYSLYQSKGNTAATNAANNALSQNNLVSIVSSTITPGSYTNGSTTYTSAMYVQLTSARPTPFMSLIGHSTTTLTATARAATVPEGNFCFLALENTNTTGVTFSGNSTLNLGCGVATNSTSTTAAIAQGSSSVTASPVAAMGTVPPASNYAPGTVLISNHATFTDPFAGTDYNPTSSNVSNGTCKQGSNWNVIDVGSNVTLDLSNVHGGCYGTINVQGTLTLGSGTYYLADGANNAGLKVGAQGHLTCYNCAFVLTSTTPNNANSHATMNINAGAEIDISAPTSGTYNGITIYRDNRAGASNQCCTINGNASSSFNGAFYFPNDVLSFNGTSGMSLNCFQLVGRKLDFSGNATITNTCTLPGGNQKWALDTVRLIT